MKKLLAACSLIIFLFGCSNSEIKTKEDIVNIGNQGEIADTQFEQLVKLLKDRKNDKEVRYEAYKLLKAKNYPKLKNILEELTPDEKDLKDEFLKTAMTMYKNFKYSSEDRITIYKMLLKKSAYSEFFNSYYQGEDFEISEAMVDEVDYVVYLTEEKELQKFYKLILLSNNKKLFRKMLEKNTKSVIEYFIDKKEEWILEKLTENKDFFIRIREIITKDNYPKYKNLVYKVLNEKSFSKETIAAEVIVEMEGDLEQKLVSSNYFIQKIAINKYGEDESLKYLEKRMDLNDFNVYRGLAFIKSDKIFGKLDSLYQKSFNITCLEYIYILGGDSIERYLKKEIEKLDIKNKVIFFEKIKQYNLENAVEWAFGFYNNNKNILERQNILDFIIDNDSDYFIRIVSELMENPKYSPEEKKYFKKRLGEVAGEEAKEQILKTLENKIYSLKVKSEKDIISFSGKIKLWDDYLINFPGSYFEEQIKRKLESYSVLVEKLKNEVADTMESQNKRLDIAIAEYRDYINKETKLDRINAIKEKITTLEKEKANIEIEAKRSVKDKIKEMEKDYFNISYDVNNLMQRLKDVEKPSSLDYSEEKIRTIRQELDKSTSKRSEILEKIIIFYGMYGDKIGIESLNQDILRDMKGQK